jgi:glycosyltransferase involved in cell wall biosynthesis
MRILHLSKNDLQGGAARSAYRLHKGLQKVGHDSRMFVAARTSDDPSVSAFAKPMDLANLVHRGVRQLRIGREFDRYKVSRPAGYELFSDDRNPFAGTLLDQLPAADVVNLHWVPGFVDYRSFLAHVARSTPIVWTLHDMNPFTGGCHYNLGCANYLQRCGHCPQLGSTDENDLAARVWRRKQRVFGRIDSSRLRIVTPSKWLADEARRSPILNRFPTCVIPYGLNLEEFSPRCRGNVRELLGISREARVLLFVAEEVGSKRKGFASLLEALTLCAGLIPNLLLLSIGQNRPELPAGIPGLHVASVNNDRFLSMVYSAADLFAICSIQDNLPNTVLEAMACGIPVAGFAVGGVPDMVRTGVNGAVVPAGDVRGLAGAICDLLNNGARCAEMGANARNIALQEYSLELQAQRYANLYAGLL